VAKNNSGKAHTTLPPPKAVAFYGGVNKMKSRANILSSGTAAIKQKIKTGCRDICWFTGKGI